MRASEEEESKVERLLDKVRDLTRVDFIEYCQEDTCQCEELFQQCQNCQELGLGLHGIRALMGEVLVQYEQVDEVFVFEKVTTVREVTWPEQDQGDHLE